VATPPVPLTDALRDRYLLERELGRGGMGTVYLARDLKHDRLVALKVLRPDVATLGSERFLREVRLTASLQHPHILPLYDSGEAAGRLWYTMPYVEGESLRDQLRREVQLPLEAALNLVSQVALALDYAHQRGVVHRDIKPENILLSGGQALVADFGIARALDAAGGAKLTETGLAVGTPAYMSPEQASAGQVDGRSDLYALGCVLYEMLAGEPPFTGPTAQAIIAKRFSQPVPGLRVVRETVPESVDKAVAVALAKVPADRFATAGEFAAALRAPSVTAGVSPARAAVRRRWLVPAVAASILSGVAAVAWLKLHASGPMVVPSASAIAVLPFAPSVTDTELTRLGRDLALTLSTTLDGVGEIRTVDAHTVLAQSPVTARAYSLAQGMALGRRFGAGSIVHGSLVRAGSNVRLDLGLFTTDSAAPFARVSVAAPPDSIEALTNAATWALLPQIWRRGRPPSPSLDGALKTHSAVALRAFLEGERALIANQWSNAADAYAVAIAADSTFWLAYWRYAFSRGYWHGEDVDSVVVVAFQAHRSDLPARDRLSIEAFIATTGGATARLAKAKEVTERFPDYWFGWLEYGDFLVHWAPLLGHTRAEAREALERAVELNPRLIPAWEHLMWLALQDHDTVASSRGIEALSRLGAGPALAEEQGSDELLQFRLLDRLQRGDTADARALADSVARSIAKSRTQDFSLAFPRTYGFPATEIAVRRHLLRLGIAPDAAAFSRLAIAVSWAARGAWDSALVAADQYMKTSRDIDAEAPLNVYRLAVMAVWLGAVDAAEAAKRRAAAALAGEQLGTAGKAELAWMDGVLAVVRRDRPALAAARLAVRESGDSNAVLLDQSLGAFDLALTGALREAGDSVAVLEWTQAEQGYPDDRSYPALSPLQRLAAARWLLATGDTAQAARLLTCVDAYFAHPSAMLKVPLRALVELERARIEQARGRVGLARAHYQQFLMRYDMPGRSQLHLVSEAEAALARLSGQRDPLAEHAE
jgi:TolB-like protein